tara:strand:- start:7985 stop:8170 length:186 start_codon:yes stop_codon:yes gene_type:complete
MSVIKIKPDGVIGIDHKDIAFIYKYGIVFLDETEFHFPQYWIKNYVKKHNLEHLYAPEICG